MIIKGSRLIAGTSLPLMGIGNLRLLTIVPRISFSLPLMGIGNVGVARPLNGASYTCSLPLMGIGNLRTNPEFLRQALTLITPHGDRKRAASWRR